ncbi:MAG: gliding motility protein GldN [Bacteroidetes bacterium]|jgi:gliding motility associated protien GldN|nr:gliding motility protein GldN [Bacteroidota bacterium]
MSNKAAVLLILGLFGWYGLSAQDGEAPASNEDYIGDFTYTRLSIRERKPVPYPSQREADVMYAKRIVRIMDTKEKQNLVCRWPKNPLSEIIFTAAEKNEVVAYKNDSLTSFFRADTVLARLSSKEVIQIPDPMFPGEFKDSVVINKYNLDDIVRYELIEDWIFDKQRGMFYPRIIAIAPMYNLIVDGNFLGEYQAFVCDWKQVRKVLINEEVFNRHNDAAKFSYYDWFELRLFSSYITKEPNVFDETFSQYVDLKDNPLAQLLEAERVKNELFNWEHDLWQY